MAQPHIKIGWVIFAVVLRGHVERKNPLYPGARLGRPIRKYRHIAPGVITPVLAKHTKNLSLVDVQKRHGEKEGRKRSSFFLAGGAGAASSRQNFELAWIGGISLSPGLQLRLTASWQILAAESSRRNFSDDFRAAYAGKPVAGEEQPCPRKPRASANCRAVLTRPFSTPMMRIATSGGRKRIAHTSAT